jgi:hypothetical protein
MPNTAPANPPATAATVSVSPPRSMTSRSTSAKSRPCRRAHNACAGVGNTVPLDSGASDGDQPVLDVLTKTVVDVGAASGSGVELSDGIHPDPGGRSCLTLMPG